MWTGPSRKESAVGVLSRSLGQSFGYIELELDISFGIGMSLTDSEIGS